MALIVLYRNGVFRYEKADWNSVSGEICDSSARREDTWAFKEGWTYPERGGGVAVKLTITANGTTGDGAALQQHGLDPRRRRPAGDRVRAQPEHAGPVLSW